MTTPAGLGAELRVAVANLEYGGLSEVGNDSVRLASPLGPCAQRLMQLAGRRDKTIEDRIEIARVGFEGALYWAVGAGPASRPGRCEVS